MSANAIALDALKKIVKNAEQSKFEDWLEAKSPSGDVEQVQRQWENSGEYREFCDKWADAFAAIAALEAEPQGWRDIASAPTEAPQEFESVQGRALALAWAEGWAQCRDAEYVGEEAENEAFNQSHTLAKCLHADQTRFQGGLSNDQLRRAWGVKLPNVIPTDEQLTAFALGIEVSAAPPGTTPADTEKD